MTTKVIVVSNTKGGAGKSTTAINLAVQIVQAGDGPVCMMDLDPQGSTAKWWNVRPTEDIAYANVDLNNLASQVHELGAKGVKYLIIDTPPLMVDNVQLAIDVADLVIVPTRPSPMDLMSLGPTVEMCRAADKKPLFVINGAAHRARITADTAIALSEHGRVCPVVVYARTDYATGIGAGLSMQEIAPRSKGSDEVAELWLYAKKLLSPAASKQKKVIA
ncbi:AAA family ATPase [Rubrivivax gelatinosus]|uniref:AAA family ATPase n=1 Tax=Rubrivivax gelatinosus TaxID=28068 RepID=UPI0006832C8E|nr:AAA family ATPase [Rubrivivax gelatinosus]MBG6083225.1 chromosome partitioning protein [Rubrivivax gelatinosus]